jgi:hypothetical protein
MPRNAKKQAKAKMNAYEARVRTGLGPRMGSVLPSAWLRAMNLARRVYGLSRRKTGDELVQAGAEAGVATVGRGLTEDQAVDTVHISLTELGCGFTRERVSALVREALQSRPEPGPAKPVPDRPKVEVKSGKARSLGRLAISLSEVGKETPLEKFTRTRATEQLRYALAPHQLVVKRCVALRLCKHMTYKELAEELGLSTEQVEDILTRMRGWVAMYTTFFEHDWYWKEGVIDLPGTGRSDKDKVQSPKD